ncbi:putative quinone oxidoreductase [Zancudomyces culisetae]|uniref:Probable quinone oxidoreductase n=1 Tax=Zancudomyces culisetae TaxID=1213189 RepID=A0A1R1PU64_ZANCU|nr:putative quinone oxidoreductase [Zancudomyces culisetae]OMH84453.1 putative quinone oxidoreductase [Zancudomyces culisetae]|eukprot:OMH84305.1 putative quinone oxidoreductase [Zancudomyces culisetae]
MSSTMKAIRIEKPGDVSVIKYLDIPKPQIEKNKMLVKNKFAGVNFIDTYFRTGLYIADMPMVLGREGSGIVEEVGSDVTGFETGSRVAYLSPNNAYAEYILVDPEKAIIVPEQMALDTASASLIQGLTALTFVKRAYNVKKGDVVLVHAAAGGTGRLLVQLCKHYGATVIGTTSNEEKAKLATDAGADHIIYYTREDVPTRVREITNGQMVNAVFDGVGKSTFQASFDSLRRCGTLVSFGNASGKVPPIEINILSKGNIVLLRPMLYDYIYTREEFTEACSTLFDLVESGSLKVNICKEFDLKDAADAHRFIEAGKTTGKILLRV